MVQYIASGALVYKFCEIDMSLYTRTVELSGKTIFQVAPSRSRRDHRKSKFGLRHDIYLIWLYVMTKSEF